MIKYRLYRDPEFQTISERFSSPGSPGYWTEVVRAVPGGIAVVNNDPSTSAPVFDESTAIYTNSAAFFDPSRVQYIGTIAGVGSVAGYRVAAPKFNSDPPSHGQPFPQNYQPPPLLVTERVWVEGSPASTFVSTKTIMVGRSGWDGGGRGDTLLGNGDRVAFQFGRLAAVQAGVGRPGTEYSFAATRYGWYRHDNAIDFIMSGQIVGTYDSDISDSAINGWRFAIRRFGGRILWELAQGESAPFEVVHSARDDTGALVAIGMIYTLGDTIDHLDIETFGGDLSGTLPLIGTKMTESGTHSGVVSSLPAISSALVSDAVSILDADLPAVRSRMGSVGYYDSSVLGRISMAMSGIVCDIRSEPTFSVGAVFGSISPIAGGMSGVVGATGGISSELGRILARLEQSPSGRISSRLPAAASKMTDVIRQDLYEFPVIGDSHSLDSSLLLIIAEGVGIGDEVSISLIIDLVTAEGLSVGDGTSLGELITVMVDEGVYVGDRGSITKIEAIQYAINLATGAPSVYRGFDFLGFVRIDDIAYGWKGDGLYRIGGDRDGDDLIGALIDFGVSDYGTALRKRISSVWLGLRTDGQTYLKVRADNGREHVYRARKSEDASKVIVGKGLAGRQWSIALEIKDASFASLDSVEIEISASDRRFGGR